MSRYIDYIVEAIEDTIAAPIPSPKAIEAQTRANATELAEDIAGWVENVLEVFDMDASEADPGVPGFTAINATLDHWAGSYREEGRAALAAFLEQTRKWWSTAVDWECEPGSLDPREATTPNDVHDALARWMRDQASTLVDAAMERERQRLERVFG